MKQKVIHPPCKACTDLAFLCENTRKRVDEAWTMTQLKKGDSSRWFTLSLPAETKFHSGCQPLRLLLLILDNDTNMSAIM